MKFSRYPAYGTSSQFSVGIMRVKEEWRTKQEKRLRSKRWKIIAMIRESTQQQNEEAAVDGVSHSWTI